MAFISLSRTARIVGARQPRYAALEAASGPPPGLSPPLGKGTGQGLAIAHAIVVDKHGGGLSFESEVGKGTTFTIQLPVQCQNAIDP